jgi:hypothetical protein
MMHIVRRYCVSAVSSAEELARMLTKRTWTLCTGFYVQGHAQYLFLNDSTHEDGAGEWAVIHGGLADRLHRQIESVTMSWCSCQQGLTHIEAALSGVWDNNEFRQHVSPRLETPEQHKRCSLCA